MGTIQIFGSTELNLTLRGMMNIKKFAPAIASASTDEKLCGSCGRGSVFLIDYVIE